MDSFVCTALAQLGWSEHAEICYVVSILCRELIKVAGNNINQLLPETILQSFEAILV